MREHKGESIIALPTDYIVIDTETTGLDYERCSLIEVSALKYSNGVCVDRFSSLIQPPLLHLYRHIEGDCYEVVEAYVDDFISSLTGITNEMLKEAPKPQAVIPEFLSFIGDAVLIGHNAHFDINFLYDAAMEVCGRPLTNDFIDTLRIARKVFPNLAHHRLADIADACEVKASNAHRSEADCETTASCYEWMRKEILSTSTEDDFIRSYVYDYSKTLSSITATTDQIDPTNPIYGKTVVFTGALSSMSRKDAFQLVANLGGCPKDNLNAQTNFLVIGNTDFIKSIKEGKTNKMKKAEAMIQKGLEISIVSESTFFDLISAYQVQ